MEELFIAILFILMGVFLFVLYFYLYKKAKNSKKWNTVKGLIMRINLDELLMGQDSTVTYKVKIQYSYKVGEKTYYSKRIFYGDFLRHSSLGNIERMMNKYKKENIIDVFYNPQKPNESVLELGINFDLVTILITSLLLFMIGVILIYSKL